MKPGIFTTDSWTRFNTPAANVISLLILFTVGSNQEKNGIIKNRG